MKWFTLQSMGNVNHDSSVKGKYNPWSILNNFLFTNKVNLSALLCPVLNLSAQKNESFKLNPLWLYKVILKLFVLINVTSTAQVFPVWLSVLQSLFADFVLYKLSNNNTGTITSLTFHFDPGPDNDPSTNVPKVPQRATGDMVRWHYSNHPSNYTSYQPTH